MTDTRSTLVGLTAVIVAVTDEVPRVLVVRRLSHELATPAQRGQPVLPADSPEALPFGPFEPATHRTLELGLRGWVEEQTGFDLRYIEQLYTFGNEYRDPRELSGGPRVLSVGYLALTAETPVAGTGEAQWRDWYDFLPWEDGRAGRPAMIDAIIVPGLERWIAAATSTAERERREERARVCFAWGGETRRDPVLTLERYELLYEASLVPEALRDRRDRERARGAADPVVDPEQLAAANRLGAPMALDNRRILAAALGRLRGKLAYRPVVFELLPPEFTLWQLQRVVEALAGVRLHKQNFRRMVLHDELVEPTGRIETFGRGRPAELYRFRREVLRARAAVGVGLPAARAAE